MLIRLATRRDTENIRACAVAAYSRYIARIGREPAPMVADFPTLVDAERIHVAMHRKQLIGFVVFYPAEGCMHLESVAILPDHAGQGIGRMLIAFVESESRRCGYPAVELYTNEKMVENLALYPKLGYRETGRHYEAGFNRVYFRKTLDVDPVPTPGAIVLRRATVADAPQFIDLWRTLDAESEYLMYEPGERQTTVAQQQAYLSDMEHSELAAVFVLDETAADGLVGFAGGRRSATRRDRHVLRLVIAIRQSHIGLGYGLSLLEALESWARTKGVTRLELGVMAGNEHAIALYRKFGFAHEGTRINGVHLASGYVDEHLMGKWLGPVATT